MIEGSGLERNDRDILKLASTSTFMLFAVSFEEICQNLPILKIALNFGRGARTKIL